MDGRKGGSLPGKRHGGEPSAGFAPRLGSTIAQRPLPRNSAFRHDQDPASCSGYGVCACKLPETPCIYAHILAFPCRFRNADLFSHDWTPKACPRHRLPLPRSSRALRPARLGPIPGSLRRAAFAGQPSAEAGMPCRRIAGKESRLARKERYPAALMFRQAGLEKPASQPSPRMPSPGAAPARRHGPDRQSPP